VPRFLPANLTRPEIAGELSVSLNTVHTHIRRIYAKLGATDRSFGLDLLKVRKILPEPGE